MRVITTSLETYKEELIKVIENTWEYDFVIVGGYAKEVIKQLNMLRNHQFIHLPEFDARFTSSTVVCFDKINTYHNCIAIESYNAIFMRKGKVVAQVLIDPETIPVVEQTNFTTTYFQTEDLYDLENDLLDGRATYKEIVLEDNKLKTAKNFAKCTKSPIVCIVKNIHDIKEQLIDEYDELPEKWKKVSRHPDEKHYNHYTVKDKIYHNTIVTRYYGAEVIFVEEKDIEDVSN